MVVTPDFGETYDGVTRPSAAIDALGLVDFSSVPHLDHEELAGQLPGQPRNDGPPG